MVSISESLGRVGEVRSGTEGVSFVCCLGSSDGQPPSSVSSAYNSAVESIVVSGALAGVAPGSLSTMSSEPTPAVSGAAGCESTGSVHGFSLSKWTICLSLPLPIDGLDTVCRVGQFLRYKVWPMPRSM